jgi:hypothetical protein
MTINAQPAVHVYCGPTITADEVLDNVPGAYVHPPVQHGDLLSLGASRGDTVLIIDGVFHHAAATRKSSTFWPTACMSSALRASVHSGPLNFTATE